MCSCYEAAGARATEGETCADQMTASFQAHKDDAAILEPCWPLSQALVKRLYCAASAVFLGVQSTLPIDFLDFFPRNRNHHRFSDDVGCHELQLVGHCEVGHCEVEDEDAAGGFLRGSL